MRNLGLIVLWAIAKAFRAVTKAQTATFAIAIMCVPLFIDFQFMAQNTMHTSETLNYMDSYLNHFLSCKEIILEFRASKRTKRAVRERKEALQKNITPTAESRSSNASNAWRAMIQALTIIKSCGRCLSSTSSWCTFSPISWATWNNSAIYLCSELMSVNSYIRNKLRRAIEPQIRFTFHCRYWSSMHGVMHLKYAY